MTGNGGGFEPIRGGNNIDIDPLFITDVDLMALPSTAGNARPQDGSPVINAGDNSLSFNAQDLDGRARIQMGSVDLGAYEGSGLLFSDGFEDND